jgi:hypothetical protein
VSAPLAIRLGFVTLAESGNGLTKSMKANRGEARATDLNFLSPAGHTTGLTASVLWTFPLTSLDPGSGRDDMDGALRLVGAVIPVGGIFSGGWAGKDERSGYKISERVKRWEGQREHRLGHGGNLWRGTSQTSRWVLYHGINPVENPDRWTFVHI